MSNELVTVATFNDPIEAAMARNYLEAAGISAMLLDETTVATHWGMANAVGGIKLQVSLANLAHAEVLLDQIPDDEPDDMPSIALAMSPTADEPPKELDDGSTKDQAVDRLFRATIFGLIFWPLQFYALWMLVTLPIMVGNVSPQRRWMVGVSLLLNLPLLALIIVALFCLTGLFQSPAVRR
jgi:Putative prokaryotic signal transducing protein